MDCIAPPPQEPCNAFLNRLHCAPRGHTEDRAYNTLGHDALAPRSPFYPAPAVKTSAIFFPFDLFGSAGAGAGAELLAEAFQEMLADNRRERVPTRARA